MNFKGIDLLEKIFEFREMTPDSKMWTISALQGNQPRQIRLKKINSLISAFFQEATNDNFLEKAKQLFTQTNSESIHTILSGEFLKGKKINEYLELIELIKTTVNRYEKLENEEREIHILKLVMPYQQLIKYKQELRKLLTFNSGWYEASSVTSRFSIYLTNSISQNLKDKYSELDNALELFINPKHLSFSEEELISKYNFPKESINDVDMENW
jgi:hypothetical protein